MITVKVDIREVQRELEKFKRKIPTITQDFLVDSAKIAARQCAIQTQPYGISNKQRDILQTAVVKDMSKVYWAEGRTYNELKKTSIAVANAFAKAIHEGDLSTAEQIISKYTQHKFSPTITEESLEDRRSDSSGRVEIDDPVIVKGTSDLENLKNQKKVSAGYVKSNWLQMVSKLRGSTRIPVWLRKKANNFVQIAKYFVKITNAVDYSSSLISESKLKAIADKAIKQNLRALNKKMKL
jgi:hypothetical protein